MLAQRPISTPAIFSLAGVRADETAIIERTETDARVHEGPGATANHWQAPGWHGHRARSATAAGACARCWPSRPSFDAGFAWLAPPILNRDTRLVMIADASEGRLMAQGFEATRPATEPLDLAP